MIVAEQDDLVAAMQRPDFYPVPVPEVEHLTTHISHVFLAGPFVYKLKRNVVLPFLDFSSVEQRRRACEEELRLNRRLAAGVYFNVLPVTRGSDGRPRLGGGGDAIDYVVWMRRLPADAMLDERLRRGTVPAGCLARLAERLATFHDQADAGPTVNAHGDPEVVLAAWNEILGTAKRFVGQCLSSTDHELLGELGQRFVDRHAALLRRRQRESRIREGHGDLKAEHICVLDAPLPGVGRLPPLGPGFLIYDCVEFSRALRCGDVASEIAFLSIDLEAAGRADLADELTAHYAARTGDSTLAQVLPFYAAYRALVRGVVDGMKQATGDGPAAIARAAAWFRRAIRHAWRAEGPCVVAVCGRSGTGKTTVAARLAELTGLEHISSDVLRKRQAGVALDAPAPAGSYTAEARAAVYDAMGAAADVALRRGRGAIVDATFLRRAERDAFARHVVAGGAPLLFVECCAADRTVERRLATRPPGPSDATWPVFLQQQRELEPLGPSEPHVTLDTDRDPDTVGRAVLHAVWQWRKSDPTPGRPPPRQRRATAQTPYRTISGCASK